MRKHTMFLLLFLLAACSKDPNNPTPPPNPPGGNNPGNPPGTQGSNGHAHHFIPNWATDTLIGYAYPESDTLYVGTSNDSSYVIFKSVKYYLWTSSVMPVSEHPDWFEENSVYYYFCYIGIKAFDNENALTGGVGAYPHKYYDSNYGVWKEQSQKLSISSLKPPFADQGMGMGIFH